MTSLPSKVLKSNERGVNTDRCACIVYNMDSSKQWLYVVLCLDNVTVHTKQVVIVYLSSIFCRCRWGTFEKQKAL